MKTAYSYARVSSGHQTTGSGLDRQIALAETWAASRGLRLDKSLKLQDEGRSAHKGKHLEGAMGQLIKLAESGRIEKDSYLLIEALDRISRLEPMDGLEGVVFKLIRAGFRIVTLEDGVEYSSETLRDDATKLVVLVVKIGEAYRYSQRLGSRVGKAHLKREADLKAGKARSIGQLPFWISRNDSGELYLNDQAEIVREAFRLSEEGMGGHRIARKLNDAGHTTKGGKTWTGVNVNRFFTHPSSCGDAVFRGKVIPDLYPAAVSRERYEAATHRRAQNPGRRGGFAGAQAMHWIGQGLSKCSMCGSSIGVHSGTNRDGSRDYRLRCLRAHDGGCASKGWKLEESTQYLLGRLTRAALQQILGSRADTSGLERQLTAAKVELDAAKAKLASANAKAVEAAQDPESTLRIIKLLDNAIEAAEQVVANAEQQHVSAQVALQAASAQSEDLELPVVDLKTPEGRHEFNAGLKRLGLQILLDWDNQRWGLSLPGTEMVWSTFGPNSWLEFDWVGPGEDLDPAAEAWLKSQEEAK